MCYLTLTSFSWSNDFLKFTSKFSWIRQFLHNHTIQVHHSWSTHCFIFWIISNISLFELSFAKSYVPFQTMNVRFNHKKRGVGGYQMMFQQWKSNKYSENLLFLYFTTICCWQIICIKYSLLKLQNWLNFKQSVNNH